MRGGEKKIMTFTSRITIAIATGAVLVSSLAPLANADTATVAGNGTESNNTVTVSVKNTNTVNQSNTANITNHIVSNAATGDNTASKNTGGSQGIQTGNATNNVTVTNAVNLNKADVSCASCNSGALTVKEAGNGDGTDNNVNATNTNSVFVNQTNNANLKNSVTANAFTGKNDTSLNTHGANTIVTGNAHSTVNVTNAANANIAQVSGGNNGSSDPSSAVVSGNGVYSDNGIHLNQNSSVVVGQRNLATIGNVISAEAKTGRNEAEFNTGGSSGIGTGNATTNTTVDNAVNFNAASLNCDCVLSGLNTKVAGNGDGSNNAVTASANNSQFPTQLNNAGLLNSTFGNAKTGDNNLQFGTTYHGDPLIITGNGNSGTTVSNTGGVNTLGNINLGNYQFGFDFSGLASFLNGFGA